MTEIRFRQRRGFLQGKYELSMSGHADFCPGNDTLCAALSSLFFSLCNYLDDIGCSPIVKYEPGKAYILCSGGIRVRLAFEFVLYAFSMLERAYPDNVRVNEL